MSASRPVRIVMGYDRALRGFYLLVERAHDTYGSFFIAIWMIRRWLTV